MPDLFCKHLWKQRLPVIWLALVICNLTNTFSKGVGIAWKVNFKFTFRKLTLHHFIVRKRPILVPVFTNRKIAKKNLHFYKKAESGMECSVFCNSCGRGGSTPGSGVSFASSKLPKLWRCLWAPVLYLDLTCVSVIKTCLRYQKSLRELLRCYA